MTSDFDTIIVGGGPVGLSAGIQLARQGIRTLICEKSSFPRDKACGEGIMPTGVAYLRELGLLDMLSPSSCHPFNGICYFAQSGSSAKADFREGPGLGIRRTELSRALLDLAQKTPGLEVLSNTPILAFERDGYRIRALAQHRQFSARVIVGADGIRSQVRNWANLNGSPSQLRRFGANQHFALKPWSNYVEVYYQADIEAYVTPCGTEQVGVAFLWHRDRFIPSGSGKNLIHTLLAQFPVLQERLQHSIRIGPTQAIGPLHTRAKSIVADNIVLIGDAAGYLDPITGEGVSIGLLSARLICDRIASIFSQKFCGHRNYFSRAALQAYAAELKNRTRQYYRTTNFILMLSEHPNLIEKVIAELDRDLELFTHLLSVNMGLSRLFSRKLPQLAKVAWWLALAKRPKFFPTA